jgi:hypothetical protein
MSETLKRIRDVLAVPATRNDLVVVPPSPPTLDERAARVRRAHADIEAALLTAAERSLDAGLELKAAKSGMRHGLWQDYVATCGISMRTAQCYMQIAKHEGEVRQLLAEKAQGNAHLSVTALLTYVKMLDAKKRPKLKRKPSS